MIVTIKDAAKLLGVIIISACAVFVCTLFLNYSIDLPSIENEITNIGQAALYDAQQMTNKVVCLVSGGCLLLTSVVTLFFYIKLYIDAHRKNLAILKALGYSGFKIASRFFVFGFSVFIGAAAGFAGSFALMPTFYFVQNEDGLLPEVQMNFHFELFIFMVLIPSLIFALLSVLYGCFKLRLPVLSLMNYGTKLKNKNKKHKENEKSAKPFLKDLKRSTLTSRVSLTFFIVFSSFCFAAMTQMSFSMKDLSSELMAVVINIIGLTLSFTTLLIAVTTVINSNSKTIAMMRITGYSYTDCRRAILGCYRVPSYIGFLIGTGYQYGLLKIMVEIVFAGIDNVPDYEFDTAAFLVTLALFAVVYELTIYCCSRRINKISIKEIMLDN